MEFVQKFVALLAFSCLQRSVNAGFDTASFPKINVSHAGNGNGFGDTGTGMQQINQILNKGDIRSEFGSAMNPLNITQEDMNEIARILTIGCYGDVNMIPTAIVRCVGTSVALINQLLSLLAHELIGVYFTPSQELKEQSSCFVDGLGLLTEDGKLSEAGLQRVLDGIAYDANLRNYVAEGVALCTTPDKETHDLALCIEHALLIRCKINPTATM